MPFKNPEKRKQYLKLYHLKNKEKTKKQRHQYYLKNRHKWRVASEAKYRTQKTKTLSNNQLPECVIYFLKNKELWKKNNKF